jgi:tetratricopeptide (TPR) repeat protein
MSLGQLTRALAYLESALSLHRELGDREGETATRDNIGKIHHSRGETDAARRSREAALETGPGQGGETATRRQESGDREGVPPRALEAEEILRRAGSAELQEKGEASDPNARVEDARRG